MTISTTYAPVQYNGNSVTTVFAFPYKFFDADNLLVTLTLISSGVDTVQVLNTDYTVTGGGGAVGSIVFSSAPATGYRVTIELNLPYTQQDDYVENQAFPADTLESGLDRAAIRDQQLRSLITGSLKFPATLASSYDGLLPAPENGKILTWSGITGQVANASLADISISLNTIITSPTSGQVLTWNGTNWVNAAITIPDGSITTNKIVDATITEAKLGTGSVSTRAINDGALIWSKFASSVIATVAEIIAGTTQKLISADILKSAYPNMVVQSVYSETATMTTTTAAIPVDDTIPQITEGVELLTANITPKVSTNRIRVTFEIPWASSGTASNGVIAIFQDAVANALFAKTVQIVNNHDKAILSGTFEFIAGTTSAMVIRARVGISAGTMTINGAAGARLFGGVSKAVLIVTELTA